MENKQQKSPEVGGGEIKKRTYRITNILANVNQSPFIGDIVDFARTLTNSQIRCHIHEAREEGFNYQADLLECLLEERTNIKYC